MTTSLLQAILGGQRRPNPKGGLIFLRRVSTSMCLILPFPSGSYSAQEVTNSSRWCAPSIDQSLVFKKEFYRVTDMLKIQMSKRNYGLEQHLPGEVVKVIHNDSNKEIENKEGSHHLKTV